MTKPGLGAGLLLVRDGKVLLYRRIHPPEAGHWNIPGGKIDLFENGAGAARREAEEETGLLIKEVESLCTVELIDPQDGQHWVSLIYRATEFSGEAQRTEPDKLSDFGWFAINALPAPLSHFARSALAAAGMNVED